MLQRYSRRSVAPIVSSHIPCYSSFMLPYSRRWSIPSIISQQQTHILHGTSNRYSYQSLYTIPPLRSQETQSPYTITEPTDPTPQNAIKLYRFIWRKLAVLYGEDQNVLLELRGKLRTFSDKDKKLTDPEEIKQKIADGYLLLKLFEKHIIQAPLNERGNWEIKIDPDKHDPYLKSDDDIPDLTTTPKKCS